MSWDEGFPGARASCPHDEGLLGARASRPHQAWHSLGHLPHTHQPATAPWLSFGLADGVPRRQGGCLQQMGFPPTGRLPAAIELKLSGGQRDRMRAGRPRSQGNHSPLEGESQKPSRQAKADAVGGGRRATSQKADLHPLGNSRVPASRAPAPGPGGSLQIETTDFCGLSRAKDSFGRSRLATKPSCCNRPSPSIN